MKMNINLTEEVQLGFSYEQDGLFQSNYVNPFKDDQLGTPNAYELPLATPYGQPEYSPGQDQKLFIWKDEITGIWELRGTAGGLNINYSGSITADMPIESVQEVKLESDDILETSNSQIDFNLNVFGSGEDGISFKFPDEANLVLNLEGGATSLSIGADEWAVSEVPLDLSGW